VSFWPAKRPRACGSMRSTFWVRISSDSPWSGWPALRSASILAASSPVKMPLDSMRAQRAPPGSWNSEYW
jgi:hypothetical protein